MKFATTVWPSDKLLRGWAGLALTLACLMICATASAAASSASAAVCQVSPAHYVSLMWLAFALVSAAGGHLVRDRAASATVSPATRDLPYAEPALLGADASGRVLYVDDSARQMLGLDALARCPDALAASQAGRQAAEVIKRAAEGLIPHGSVIPLEGGAVRLTARVIRSRTGSPGGAAVCLAIRPVDDRGQIISEQRALLAEVSHDLRTPLTAVQGFLEALLDGVADASTQDRYLGIALGECRRLEMLLNDLLDVTRLDRGAVSVDLRETDISSSVESAAARFKKSAEEQGVRLTSIVPDAPLIAMADPLRIDQVLSNLISNALQFTGEGGEIEVRAEQDEAWVRICVVDTGMGVPEDRLKTVWDRFYRCSRPRGRGVKAGLGLGLPIVKGLVELHGGHVGVESVLGAGSEFWFVIPAA